MTVRMGIFLILDRSAGSIGGAAGPVMGPSLDVEDLLDGSEVSLASTMKSSSDGKSAPILLAMLVASCKLWTADLNLTSRGSLYNT